MTAHIVWDWAADCSRCSKGPVSKNRCMHDWQVFESRQNAVVWHRRRRRAGYGMLWNTEGDKILQNRPVCGFWTHVLTTLVCHQQGDAHRTSCCRLNVHKWLSAQLAVDDYNILVSKRCWCTRNKLAIIRRQLYINLY